MKTIPSKKLVILISCVGLFFAGQETSHGSSGVEVTVEVIKADQNSSEVDPQLKDLIKELSPVLNYSGFTLLKKTALRLEEQEKGEVLLPSGRLLNLQFQGLKDNEARLAVTILEKGKETFRTILLLVNKGSVLIGGFPHKGGFLLLRIGGTFSNTKGR